jgi:hypothetical protein
LLLNAVTQLAQQEWPCFPPAPVTENRYVTAVGRTETLLNVDPNSECGGALNVEVSPLSGSCPDARPAAIVVREPFLVQRWPLNATSVEFS